MPDDLSQAPYSIAHKARIKSKKAQPYIESHGESVSPDFLLNHTNHFDKNVYTPENMIKQNEDLGGKKASIQT
jgi:hypothetical protein